MSPEITTVGKLLSLLNRGALPGTVQVGGTSKNVATRNWKAFLKLRQNAKGQLTAKVLEQWIRQVLNAEDSNVSYARVLSWDLREFSDALDEAVKPAGNGAQSGSAKLSPRELASKHGVDAGALRKRLDRWRYDHDAGYIEVSNTTPREPKYLYDESAVMPVIDALKAKPAGQKRAANGQRKTR